MRRRLLIVAAVVSLTTAPVSAHGPSGSYEGSNDHSSTANEVHCGSGTRVDPVGTTVYAGANGAEVCKDTDGAVPVTVVHGRLIVDAEDRYVAGDGDRDNQGAMQGYLRIDQTGPHCSKGADQDSTHSGTAGDPSSCDAQ